ncbi:MAG: hypothetical protein ACXVCP_18320 [Bdellovibrio sp.]
MKKILMLSLTVLALCGCDAMDALKATKSMDGKMDSMNHKMDQMGEMNSKMSKMNDGMQKTVDGIHSQELLIPLENMIKAETIEYLYPVPTSLMPYAKKFAESASNQELVELTYLWLKHINEITPVQDIDKDGKPVDLTLEQTNAFRKQRIGKALALAAIAGFVPQETVEQMVKEHIVGGTRHRKTALQFLALRAFFIKDILLEKSLLEELMDEVGKLEDSIKYMNQLEYLISLPFANLISVRTTGLSEVAAEDIVFVLDNDKIKSIASLWDKIKIKAELNLADVQEKTWTGDKEKDDEIQAEEKRRYAVAMRSVNSAIEKWKKLDLTAQ